MTGIIGMTIKALREGRGWTQEQFAEVAGVAPETVQRLEAGRTKSARQGTLLALAAALQTDVSRLLRGVTGDEMDRMVNEFSCAHCRAPLQQRTSISLEHGECDLDEFECGASIGWRERPCPKDPRFPTFEDYELHFEEDGDRWLCYAIGKTEPAVAVALGHGVGLTKAAAERWLRSAYTIARDGHAAA